MLCKLKLYTTRYEWFKDLSNQKRSEDYGCAWNEISTLKALTTRKLLETKIVHDTK